MRVAGVILAAGRSRRMGRAKALLPLDGRTFLATVVGVARSAGLAPLRVVVGADSEEVVAAHTELADLFVVNAEPDLGQLHSLRLALRSIDPEPDAAVVFLVDHPTVMSRTVRSVVEAHRLSGRPIVLPVSEGRRGHPVLFARSVFAELLSGPLEGGARHVVRADASRVEEIAVDDPGILVDIDTPADYERVVNDERTG